MVSSKTILSSLLPEEEISFDLESLILAGGQINKATREISTRVAIEAFLGRSPEILSRVDQLLT